MTSKGRWKRWRQFIKTNINLTVIISAVLLLELMTGIMYYATQNLIQRSMERVVDSEMNAIYLCVRNKLAKVEVTIDNMSWVVSEGLNEPEWMFALTRRTVHNNPIMWGCGVAFTPYYYPKRGKFFEPYSVHRGGDSIVSMQVGKLRNDYTQKEYYHVPLTQGKSHWSEPYVDQIGARSVVTTYSAPIRNAADNIVGVIFADITTGLLEDIMNEEKIYQSTQRFLVTGNYTLLAGKDTLLFREALELVKADKEISGYFMMKDRDGSDYHVFYTPVGGQTDWILINILDDGEVFYKLRRMSILLLLPVILGLLFAWLIVWRTSHSQKRLFKINAEKERIDSELQVANRIQQSMLPKQELGTENVALKGFLKPAREVGGDIYDYFMRDGKLFFCIGDVSGKGAPAAMLMAVIHALFRSTAAHESNPARIMQDINVASCQGNDSNMFVTMFIGVLDLPTGNLRFCDAGHDAPFIAVDGEWSMANVEPHLPIGVFDDTKYDFQKITLHPYNTIFLYTDGLTEAKNTAHAQFGTKRLLAVLNGNKNQEPGEIVKKVVEAVGDFVKQAEQSDDLTMLAVRYMPKHFESSMTETLTIKNDLREVARLSSFMKQAFGKMGIEGSPARKLRLAVEEAVVNVIDYAYPADTEGDITIRLLSDGHSLHCQIVDSGAAFDPTSKNKADTTLSAEDRQIGGLGILLVREETDVINYERTDGKNVLTLVKKLE